MSFFKKLGKAVGGAINAIVKDPIPTIVGAVAMAYGVPPVWAGAMSGATGAAMHGGNILEGALKGGAMGYVGAKTSTYLGGQGFSPVVVGAGTGAVLGATGSLLNGGQSMGLNALTGGIIGAATGYYVSRRGSTTVSYSDGSTVTTYPDGTSTATPAGTVDGALSQNNPPPAGISDANTAMQAVISDTSSYAVANTGLANFESASILAEAGYTPVQVESLIQSGYNVNQLVDMASVGVPANTLVSLSNSSFGESTINNLLSNNVSADQIASASDLVNNGQLNAQSATTLLRSGADTQTITQLANSGQGNQASYLIAKGVSADSVKYMIDNNVNLNDANWKLETGRLSSNQINNNVETAFPTNKPAPLPQPVAPPVQAVAPTEIPLAENIPDYAIKASWGGKEVYYDPVAEYVFNRDGSINTDAMRASYNGSENIGVKTADASRVYNQVTQPGSQVVSDAGSGNAPFKVDVSGSAGFQGNPNAVIPEYRTQGTDLATQTQIDNGTARFNASANAWEVPKDVYVPNTTIIPPNSNQPSNLQVARVTVNPSDLVTPTQPAVNVPNIPIVTPPTTAAPAVNTPAVKPVAPVAPQPTTPTVVSSSTRTSADGSVTKDDQMSDGSVRSTLISGPTGTGTPTPPPLKPLTPGVIPDDRYVAPVVVEPPPVAPPPPVTPPPVEPPPTTPPVVNVPNPPLVTEPPEKKPTTYGVYSFGTATPIEYAHGLNPGLIAPTPYYQTTNPAQSQYYWGTHPYQEGPTFNSQLYNTAPGAPATPWGAGHIQTQATPQQILAAMQGLYPNLGTQTVTGPAIPIQ
jgi:hypothetical protein